MSEEPTDGAILERASSKSVCVTGWLISSLLRFLISSGFKPRIFFRIDMKAASRQIYEDNAKQSPKAENHTKERKMLIVPFHTLVISAPL